jgi:hypothetical protein
MSDNSFRKPELSSDPALSDEEDVCAGHALGFPLKSELGFLPIETVTLDIFRCVCEIYTTAHAQPWEIAMRMAEGYLGAAEGPLFVARVTAVLRALKCERDGGLCYLSIGCQHVSPDELAIAGMLKSTRVRDEAAFERGLVLALNNAKSAERTRAAIRALAAFQIRCLNLSYDDDDARLALFEQPKKQSAYLN